RPYQRRRDSDAESRRRRGRARRSRRARHVHSGASSCGRGLRRESRSDARGRTGLTRGTEHPEPPEVPRRRGRVAVEVDLAVIGAGPAGLNAALAAAADGWTVCVIDAEGGGGRLYKLDDVYDYPHAGNVVTGPGLADQLIEAATVAGVEVVFERAESMTA